MPRLLLLVLAAPAIAVIAAWGAAALHFALAGGALWRELPAALYLVSGLAAIAALFVPRRRRIAFGCFLAATAGLFAWWSTIEPSNDRDWKPEVAVLPYAEIDGDRVIIRNIRNFDYRTETDFTPAYYDRTYDLAALSGIDVIASYWAGPHIAHIFLSFEFGPGQHLAVSIERRDERGEGYSTVRGLFRQYELFYVVADERDVIRLRTSVRADPPEQVYLYRVQTTPEGARRLFLDYFREINTLRGEPAFYNTLLTNCTTNIWVHSGVNPGRPPFSWKVLASGHVPEYLYNLGRLDQSLPFVELRERSLINERARAAGDAADFSRRIRETTPGTPQG